MDKRKKLVKLFYEIEEFIRQKSIATDPYAFLLNKLWLTSMGKRPSAATLSGISKSDFSLLNNEFADRLGRDFVLSLSISAIISLPAEKVNELWNIKVQPKQSLLLLSDSLVLPYETEKKIQLSIGFCSERTREQPFKNVDFYPVSRDAALSVSIQTTLFDFMNNDNTAKLKPRSFDIIADDSASCPFPNENRLSTLSFLLNHDSVFYLLTKKSFISSPLTRKEKESLYSFFDTGGIDRFDNFLQLKLLKKIDGRITPLPEKVIIRDFTDGKTLELDRKWLDFNHLYTFNDRVTAEQLAIVAKIEERAGGFCEDYFRFFLGMFRNTPIDSVVEPLRKSAAYHPFITSREIFPFIDLQIKKYIYPDPDIFFQIPAESGFESRKLLTRYLSVKPVFAYDEDGIYFLNDVAAVIPRTSDIDMFFAEGYLNSKLIEFFYRIKFPHHTKFLKKNFNKIPFMLCTKNLQKIISDLVLKIRGINSDIILTGDSEAKRKEIATLSARLDGFIYQLFKLSQPEIAVIEHYLNEKTEVQEADDEK